MLRCCVFVLALAATGCVSAPDYAPPEIVSGVEAQADFQRERGAEADAPRGPQATWWRSIGGAELAGLVDALLASGPDLQAAQARVDQARALARQALGARLPAVTASGDIGELKLLEPQNLPFAETSTAAINASWEVDLFGRLRAADRAARLRADAALLARQDLEQALIAEVARLYVGAWALREQLEIAAALAARFDRTAELTAARYRSGARNLGALDVQIARQNAAAARATLPGLRAQYQIQVQAIDVLLGRRPGRTSLAFSPPPRPELLASFPAGTPAALLTERPDVALAEAELRAGLADVGVARANRLPNFSISATLTQATSPANFLGTESLIATYAAQVVAPLFQGGRLKAEVRRAKAAAEELAADFAAAALRALNEVESALLQEAATGEEVDLRAESLEAARLSDRIASERYAAGQVSLLTLLETRRALDGARQDAVAAAQARLEARISLHEALGGPWHTADEKETPQ